jgi:hypothetical protein
MVEKVKAMAKHANAMTETEVPVTEVLAIAR